MEYYCTYFDSNFLLKGMALYQSMSQHIKHFKLFILCLDEYCYDILSKLNLDYVELIKLQQIENDCPDLIESQKNRSRVEYYFTLTPCLPLFILKTKNTIDLITYLDSDLYFFDSPNKIYQELDGKSILIIEHRFPDNVDPLIYRHGRYNVGWLSFRKDDEGMNCLIKWRSQCLSWCYDRCEDGKYADQKYLDEWPDLYNNICVLNNKGANLAPWNLNRFKLSIDSDIMKVDEDSLIFFHFHGLKQIHNHIWDLNLKSYHVAYDQIILERIFQRYIRKLKQISKNPLLKNMKNKTLRFNQPRNIIRIVKRLIEKNYVFF